MSDASDWSDEDILACMVLSARKEQSIGYEGWCKPPPEVAGHLARLAKRALIKRKTVWVMPTEAGFAMIEREGGA